ncbi:MAG: hypothetical protein QXT54_02355, partial [Thermoplasmatales archaeon]
MELTNSEKKLIKYLAGKGYVNVDSLFPEFSRNELASSISWLKEKKLISVMEKPKSFYFVGPEGKDALVHGLPEEKLLHLYKSGIRDLKKLEEEMDGDLRYAIAEFLRSGARIEKGIIGSVDIDLLESRIHRISEALKRVASGSYTDEDISLLKQRKGFVGEKVRM